MNKTDIDILGALNAHAFLLEVLLAASITQGARASGADPAESGAASAGKLATLGVGNLVRPPPELAAEDHQLLMPYYAGVFTKGVKYDSEHTGFGWKNYMTASTADLTLPTICKMKRPE